MKTKYSEERFMSILWDLYRKTTSGEKITKYSDFCKEHKVTNALFPILLKHKVLKGEKLKRDFARGKTPVAYTWHSIAPNIHMAKKLMEEIKKNNKEANIRYQKRMLEKRESELNTNSENYNDSKISWNESEHYEKASDDVNINPVYEMKQATIDTEDFNKYDIKIPVSETPFISNPVTLSTDAPKNENMRLSGNHKPKNQKSISIAWGLISIKW